MENKHALKPCPFCAAPAESDSRQGYRALDTGRIGNAAAIYCTACPAQVSMCYADSPERCEEDVQDHVRELWNARSPDPDDEKWRQIRASCDATDSLNASAK